MFKEETLFILGAGASFPYGYPLGKKLITDIIENISKDDIYLPLTSNKKYIWGNQTNSYPLTGVKDHLEKLDSEIIKSIYMRTSPIGTFSDKNHAQYKSIKLASIASLDTLKQALIDFDPTSIDAFIRDNESHALAGKTMIIYSLLKCEDKRLFGLDLDKMQEKDVTKQDNWYSYLLNDILSGCQDIEGIMKNKLNFLTFNYSLDLEYCLLDKLHKTGALNNDSPRNKVSLNEFLKKIHHVYGKLYDDSYTTYGEYFFTKGEHMETNMNTLRFKQSLKSSKNIKTISEERKFIPSHVALIKKAKEIIIIGFSFDRENLNMLGFPNDLKEFKKILKGKTVKYMDYRGKMNSLYDQFININKFPKTTIIRSISTSITDAYQNDFKIYLYQ